jgi:uncharacterized protein YaaR (DUF327 family)
MKPLKHARGTAAARALQKPFSAAQQDAYRRVLDALSFKRRNPHVSLSKAAKTTGTTLRTIRRYADPVLTIRSGRIDVRATDRLPRPMRLLTAEGEQVIRTSSARTASRIARYNNALREFLNSGNSESLKRFAGKAVRSRGQRYAFVTDEQTIRKFARPGELHFLDVYDMGAAS